MLVKRFAQIIGVVLILVGLVGLVLGDKLWLGILNIDIVEDIVHLATGGLLAYVGFSGMDLSTARSVVLALGIIYLLQRVSRKMSRRRVSGIFEEALF
jgi:hypothetical protein